MHFSAIVETSTRTPAVQIGAAAFSSTAIIVCAVSSVMFLIIGYVCGYVSGWFGHKHKQSHASKSTKIIDSSEKNTCSNEESQTPAPMHEELHTLKHQDLVELKENVAYGPIAK